MSGGGTADLVIENNWEAVLGPKFGKGQKVFVAGAGPTVENHDWWSATGEVTEDLVIREARNIAPSGDSERNGAVFDRFLCHGQCRGRTAFSLTRVLGWGWLAVSTRSDRLPLDRACLQISVVAQPEPSLILFAG